MVSQEALQTLKDLAAAEEEADVEPMKDCWSLQHSSESRVNVSARSLPASTAAHSLQPTLQVCVSVLEREERVRMSGVMSLRNRMMDPAS